MIALQNRVAYPPAKVDISLLLKSQDEEEAAPMTTTSTFLPRPVASTSLAPMMPVAAPAHIPATLPLTGKAPASVPAKRLQPAHTAESPAKKQSKWSPEEDALIIELRGSGMKWEDISKRLPGRSAISCRLHYQNYLERRSEWDEDKKNKLARLYERFKAEMWSKVAEEMAIPWRAAEAMHWQLGEQEMARRAGVVPFSLSSAAIDPPTTRIRRASTSLSRPRKGSTSRTIPPPQLPSVEELTAGVPAFAPAPPYPPPRDAYQFGRPLDLAGSHGGHLGPPYGLPPRTLPYAG
ncbi:MYB DNA-binding domain protein [Aspergillus clavatus NRRL 1]|uniref:MYB DNA-binding domain protein n=1 Tax=Aspergillus clavatus (strain ATCC 1007 / CBS 513.65 / DSM 816 / NCTC 3887 / NRRL 1 / QM 1276 / 107) TaxID=344612 RepID=A1CQR1_ASPCL|nr:MYB DNA-binding domain protein [Aspergillus clavatus NRRL 1]EAW07982.1 MYB DNA-binding domain protein [Aspergillus clavatus NRRL 1]